MIQALMLGASVLGGIMGGNATKKAAKQTAAAQDRATQMNAQLAREQMALAERYNAPYAQAGVGALNALQSRVLPGAAPQGNALAPSKQGNAGGYYPEGQVNRQGLSEVFQAQGDSFGQGGQGGPDFNAYINAPENRDILDHYNQLAPQDKARFPTAADFGRAHWEGIGSTENRAVTPMAAPQQQAPMAEPQSGVYGVPEGFEDSYRSRPEGQDFRFDQARPNPNAYFGWENFKADPGYQWRVDEASKGVTANKFAQGLGLSGSRAVALQDRAANLADQTANNWWQQQNTRYQTELGQYNNDRGFARSGYDIDQARGDARYDTDRNFYNNDRNFLSGRFDRQTGDIFGLAGIGQSGAAALTGAGQNMSNSLMQGNQNSADARGNAAIAGANSTNAMIGNALTAFGMFGGGGGYGGGYGGYTMPKTGGSKTWGF